MGVDNEEMLDLLFAQSSGAAIRCTGQSRYDATNNGHYLFESRSRRTSRQVEYPWKLTNVVSQQLSLDNVRWKILQNVKIDGEKYRKIWYVTRIAEKGKCYRYEEIQQVKANCSERGDSNEDEYENVKEKRI